MEPVKMHRWYVDGEALFEAAQRAVAELSVMAPTNAERMEYQALASMPLTDERRERSLRFYTALADALRPAPPHKPLEGS